MGKSRDLWETYDLYIRTLKRNKDFDQDFGIEAYNLLKDFVEKYKHPKYVIMKNPLSSSGITLNKIINLEMRKDYKDFQMVIEDMDISNNAHFYAVVHRYSIETTEGMAFFRDLDSAELYKECLE